MKIKIKATELVDGEIEYVSLVKHGANRSPFKIIKMDEEEPAQSMWAGLMPEMDKLERRLNGRHITEKSETPTMKQKPTAEQVRKVEQREARVEELRFRLNTLNGQLLRLWESPQHPLFNRLDSDLTMQIEKTELELTTLIDDSHEMNQRSAFFRRGGSSIHSAATLSDSAYERDAAALRKAENSISLDTPMTQEDFDSAAGEIAKIDLSSLKV
jgi:hypothetical protein